MSPKHPTTRHKKVFARVFLYQGYGIDQKKASSKWKPPNIVLRIFGEITL